MPRPNYNTETTKRCPSCKTHKDKSLFHRNRAEKDGYSGYCKECDKARHYKWVAKNKNRAADYVRKAIYGVSRSQFQQLKKDQGNRCAICRKVTLSLNLDHCHKTRIIRGLLCRRCNTGLGHFYDNPKFLLNAVKYLRKPRKA